ncbi:PaaI family thioesterase [Salininema proteolyticum]|uniref:PaaI family thioesterase n=1 Tax=Salininema proteolyticum TaxID=1607685 RepID=A0ABV8U0W1_9ACTN
METNANGIFPDFVLQEWKEAGFDLNELFSAGELGARLGIDIEWAEPGRVVGRMPVEGNTQPYLLLHGGATAALAETVGSVAAMLHAGPGKGAVGVDLNITHHRSARDGYVTAVATPAREGRTVATYEIAVTDENDKRLATARLTCAIMAPDQA